LVHRVSLYSYSIRITCTQIRTSLLLTVCRYKLESFCCTLGSTLRTVEKEERNHSLYSPKLGAAERNNAVFHQLTFSSSVSFISSSPFVHRRFLRNFNFASLQRQFSLKFPCLTNSCIHSILYTEGVSFTCEK